MLGRPWPARLPSSFPSTIERVLPFTIQQFRDDIRDDLLQCYVAAREADLPVSLLRERDGLPDGARLYLVPSAKLITAPGARRLLALAEGGATVYASYFAGSSNSRRGPWITPLEEIFGVRHNLRYGLIDPIVDEVVTFELVEDLGGLQPGDVLSFKVGGSDAARAYLPVEPVDAKVLAVDGAGRPALLRHRVGTGSTVLCTYPIEYMAAHRSSSNPEDTWRLYSALASLSGVRKARSRRGSPRDGGLPSHGSRPHRCLCQLFERCCCRRGIGDWVAGSCPRTAVGRPSSRSARWPCGVEGSPGQCHGTDRDFMRNTREQEEKEGGT